MIGTRLFLLLSLLLILITVFPEHIPYFGSKSSSYDQDTISSDTVTGVKDTVLKKATKKFPITPGLSTRTESHIRNEEQVLIQKADSNPSNLRDSVQVSSSPPDSVPGPTISDPAQTPTIPPDTASANPSE